MITVKYAAARLRRASLWRPVRRVYTFDVNSVALGSGAARVITKRVGVYRLPR